LNRSGLTIQLDDQQALSVERVAGAHRCLSCLDSQVVHDLDRTWQKARGDDL
jgi:hypothetical protein